MHRYCPECGESIGRDDQGDVSEFYLVDAPEVTITACECGWVVDWPYALRNAVPSTLPPYVPQRTRDLLSDVLGAACKESMR